jgi:hypothetical protein
MTKDGARAEVERRIKDLIARKWMALVQIGAGRGPALEFIRRGWEVEILWEIVDSLVDAQPAPAPPATAEPILFQPPPGRMLNLDLDDPSLDTRTLNCVRDSVARNGALYEVPLDAVLNTTAVVKCKYFGRLSYQRLIAYLLVHEVVTGAELEESKLWTAAPKSWRKAALEFTAQQHLRGPKEEKTA